MILSYRYVTEEKGIRGILKDSCEDFIVQEIDEQGHVVNLVNQEIPLGYFYEIHFIYRRTRR